MSNVSKFNGNDNVTKIGNDGVIDFGQYYRFTPDEESESNVVYYFIPGEIYPVISIGVHHISKLVHNVGMYIPLDLAMAAGLRDDATHTVTVKYLEDNFTYVEPEEAELIRKQQLDKIQAESLAIQEDIQVSLSNPEQTLKRIMAEKNEAVVEALSKVDFSIPALPSPSVMAAGANDVVAMSESEDVQVMRKQLENQKELGNVISVYTREKNAELSLVLNKTQSLALEKSKIIMGKASSMNQSVGDIEVKINQLKLYLGEDVFIDCVSNGPVSSDQQKIKVFSHLVYADEEMLTHKLFSDNSFDHNNLNAFFSRIDKDPAFRDRVLPFERSIVVVKPRRKSKFYSEDAFEDYIQDAPNHDTFLMVRDGESVNVISSPIDYQKRLFPTQKEMDGYLDSVKDSEDVRLTDAQRSLKRLNDLYSNVCAILQGVIDRQGVGDSPVVFGPLVADKHGASFFDPRLTGVNIDFINDEDFLLSEFDFLSKPSDWVRTHCRNEFRLGELATFSKHMINESTAPSAFFFPQNVQYKPEQRWAYPHPDHSEFHQVISVDDKLGMRVELKNTSLGKNDGKLSRKKVCLAYTSEVAVVLTELKIEELEAVMQSRSARPFIGDKMTGFIAARSEIKSIMSTQKELYDSVINSSPDMSESEIHVAFMKYCVEKNIDPRKKVKSTKALVNTLIELDMKHLDLTGQNIDKFRTFALGSDLMPLAIMKSVINTYLVTDATSELKVGAGGWVINDGQTDLPLSKGVIGRLWEWSKEGFIDRGLLDSNWLKKLSIEYNFTEDDLNLNPLEKDWNFSRDHGNIHNVINVSKSSLLGVSDIQERVESSDNQRNKEKCLDVMDRFSQAMKGSDLDKEVLFDDMEEMILDRVDEALASKNAMELFVGYSERGCIYINKYRVKKSISRLGRQNLEPSLRMVNVKFSLITALIQLSESISTGVKSINLKQRVAGLLANDLLYNDMLVMEAKTKLAATPVLSIEYADNLTLCNEVSHWRTTTANRDFNRKEWEENLKVLDLQDWALLADFMCE